MMNESNSAGTQNANFVSPSDCGHSFRGRGFGDRGGLAHRAYHEGDDNYVFLEDGHMPHAVPAFESNGLHGEKSVHGHHNIHVKGHGSHGLHERRGGKRLYGVEDMHGGKGWHARKGMHVGKGWHGGKGMHFGKGWHGGKGMHGGNGLNGGKGMHGGKGWYGGKGMHGGKGLYGGKGMHGGKGLHVGKCHAPEFQMARLQMEIIQLKRNLITLKLHNTEDETKQLKFMKRLMHLNAKEASLLRSGCQRLHGPRGVCHRPLLDEGVFLHSIPEDTGLIIVDERSLDLPLLDKVDAAMKAFGGVKYMVSNSPGKMARESLKSSKYESSSVLIIVTDKIGLQRRALRLGAQVMTIKQFMFVLQIESAEDLSSDNSEESEDENDNIVDATQALTMDEA